MNDVDCPYCEEPYRIDESPQEGDECEAECRSCGREFVYVASYHVSYNSRCKDGEHDMQRDSSHPEYQFCTRCGQCESAD